MLTYHLHIDRATIIVPAALNHVIFNAITPKALRDAFDRDRGNSNGFASNRFDGNSEDQIFKYIYETRWITFGIFVGLFVVLWTPFILWKRLVSSSRSISLVAEEVTERTLLLLFPYRELRELAPWRLAGL